MVAEQRRKAMLPVSCFDCGTELLVLVLLLGLAFLSFCGHGLASPLEGCDGQIEHLGSIFLGL